MSRPRSFRHTALDERLSQAMQGAMLGAEPPPESRRKLLRSVLRIESERSREREVLYYRAQGWTSLHVPGPFPLFGWMTLPLQQNYLLGFPKPRFSW